MSNIHQIREHKADIIEYARQFKDSKYTMQDICNMVETKFGVRVHRNTLASWISGWLRKPSDKYKDPGATMAGTIRR